MRLRLIKNSTAAEQINLDGITCRVSVVVHVPQYKLYAQSTPFETLRVLQINIQKAILTEVPKFFRARVALALSPENIRVRFKIGGPILAIKEREIKVRLSTLNSINDAPDIQDYLFQYFNYAFNHPLYRHEFFESPFKNGLFPNNKA